MISLRLNIRTELTAEADGEVGHRKTGISPGLFRITDRSKVVLLLVLVSVLFLPGSTVSYVGRVPVS